MLDKIHEEIIWPGQAGLRAEHQMRKAGLPAAQVTRESGCFIMNDFFKFEDNPLLACFACTPCNSRANQQFSARVYAYVRLRGRGCVVLLSCERLIVHRVSVCFVLVMYM